MPIKNNSINGNNERQKKKIHNNNFFSIKAITKNKNIHIIKAIIR